jgi:protein required for attachment to host cells
MMPPTWVIVAERSRARIFAFRGATLPMEEIEDLVNPEARAPEHELASDRPGRTVDSSARRRHAKQPQVSPREQVALSFAREIADHVERGRKHGRFERLVIIAAPGVLGLLRSSLTEAARRMIWKEVRKNLVRADEKSIREQL